jgi:hypothetical protein
LDYAVNRYYSTQSARFLTADPYRASGGPADPGSWNRYAYVLGDPTNFLDPRGLEACVWDPSTNTISCKITPLPLPINPNGPLPPDVNGEKEVERQGNGETVLTEGTGGGKIKTSGVKRTGREQTRINAVLDWIDRNIDENCRRWLQTGSVKSVSDYIQAVQPYVGHGSITSSAPGTYVNAVTAPEDAPGYAIVVNDSGAFFRGIVIVDGQQQLLTTNNGRINGGSVEAQVFIMLHEFDHSNTVPGFESDAGDLAAGQRNNNRVDSHCGQTLQAARRARL